MSPKNACNKEGTQMEYGEVTDRVLRKFKEIVGTENVYSEVIDTLPYCRDNSPCRWSEKFKFRPDLVLTPENKEQISNIAEFCNEERIPITQRGGGTGMSGGCVPKYGGVLLDMKKMDKILEINEDDLYVRVQPGIVNLRLNRELEKKGFLGVHEPVSSPASTIGGAVSTSGVNWRQGVTGALIDEVLGLEVVLASGEIVRAGRNSGTTTLGKSSTGYDLAHLFLGDFGSLGVKTEITLKTFPLPEIEEIHLLVFPDFERMLGTIRKIQKSGLPGIFCYSASDKERLERYARIYGGEVYGGALLLGFMGDANIVEHVRNKVAKIWQEFDGEALGKEQAEAEWKSRYDQYQQLIPTGRQAPAARWHYEDPTLNTSKLAEFLRKAHRVIKKYGFDDWGGEAWTYDQTSCLAAIMYGWPETDEKNWEKYTRCANEIVRVAQQLGGSISNCLGFDKRGVGRHPVELLKTEYALTELKLMYTIKTALDPNQILNPGVMGLDALREELK